MKSLFSSKGKNEKIFCEIDKKINELDKHVSMLFNTSVNSQKKLSAISKELDLLYKCIFDEKTFNNEIFDYFLEKNIMNLLTSYVGLQNIELIKILIPLINKILFESNKLCEKIEMSEEILLVSIPIVNSIKILIHILANILESDSYDENLIDSILNFLFILIQKLCYYPNFYYAVSSSNSIDNNNTKAGFDSALFDLCVEVFRKEFRFEKRENKRKIRKAILLCMNFDYFYTINISHIEKLLEYLIENLLKYYESYKLFNADNYMINLSEKFLNTFKKEKINKLDLEDLNTYDLISYLKYFSVIVYCFSESQLKKFSSNLLFNKLFIEYIQKDVLNVYVAGSEKGENKINRIFDFLFFLTKYLRNKQINEIFFYFLFGFNVYNNNIGEFLNDDGVIRDDCGADIVKEGLNCLNDDNIVSLQDIRTNIENLIKINYHGKNNNILFVDIDKSSHKFENILTFFITIIESNSSHNHMFELKLKLLNILCNLVKNSSNLFLIEILVPYYVNFLNLKTNTKTFEKMYDKIKSYRDKIDLIEILKNIHPKNFTLDLTNWSQYFESNLEKNLERNIFMFENLNFESNKDIDSFSDNNSLFIENNFFFSSNESIISCNSPRKTNRSTQFTESFIENEDINSNSGGSFLNSFNKDSNNVINLRINFFDVLIKNFRNFATNKYIENLYLTQFFIEIYSLPYLIHMGELGEFLYNIYSNVTFATRKKFVISSISSVGTINVISTKLDEIVRFNFTKEEIHQIIQLRMLEKSEMNNDTKTETNDLPRKKNNTINLKNENLDSTRNNSNVMNHSNLTKNTKNIDFIDNLILFIEFYKEYLSNIFAKCYFDQINAHYTKALIEIDSK